MTATDKLIARLGPKVCRMPAGEKRASAGLPQSEKTLRRVKRALGLSGRDSLTRVSGSQTQSQDVDAQTPQDIAAALGFIRDPLARELFCLARWPGYAERDLLETRVLVLRMVMDEGQRLQDEAITAALQEEYEPTAANKARADQLKARMWPAILKKMCMYSRMVDLALRYLDGSGLPEQAVVAKKLKVSERRFRSTWRAPMEWIHDRLHTMSKTAEEQFRAAAKTGH